MNPLDLVMHNPGYVPVHDPRNYPYSASSLSQTAPQGQRSPFVTPISDLPVLMQGKQPSCVAHAIKFAIQQHIFKTTGKYVNLSARFLYAISKLSDGISSDGISIVNALNVARHIGICEARYFPDDVSLPYAEYIDTSKIPPEAFTNAAQYKIKNYYWVEDLSYHGLTNAIQTHGIVIAGMDIGDHWWTDAKTGEITWDGQKLLPLVPNVPPTDRHCIDLYAFNDDSELLALVNSWSDDWANRGTAFLYKDEMPYFYEAAVLEFN